MTYVLRRFRRPLVLLAILGVIAIGVDSCEGWIGTTASASAPVVRMMAYETPASCTPFVRVLFTWHLSGSDFTKITANRCRNYERVLIDCYYIGPHAAHVIFRYYGNIVRAIGAISRRTCPARPAGFPPGWTLNHSAGGGYQVSYGGSWHTKIVVGS